MSRIQERKEKKKVYSCRGIPRPTSEHVPVEYIEVHEYVLSHRVAVV